MFGQMVEKVRQAPAIRTFIIFNVPNHPTDIARLVIEKFNISRVTAVRHLQDLIQEGVLEATGKTKDRKYGLRDIVAERLLLDVTPQVQEDVVWTEQVKPWLSDLPQNVVGICAHGFTEMLNNVIDHSESIKVLVAVKRNAARVKMIVTDTGIGIFRKIQKECGLEDIHHAILELAKGKLTTDPEKHSGEGIFFTCRMFDFFMIGSDGIDFMRTDKADWLFEQTQTKDWSEGTSVTMEIATNATQTTKEIFDTYRAEFDSYGFSKTIIPLKLMEYEGEKLISRSQAKRLLRRADKFKEVVLDFKGVTEIGQAFADEIFRVYRKANPHVHLYAVNEEHVSTMISRALRADGENEEPLFKDSAKERK
jgi:anti-sigma regulatory factor (Ser/Thr protein kinase)